ncbi:MAG: hypothetical protein OXT67_11790 [Zetaproteobacteria bacterium]|nr:hypothetical protein [Zetaproteobacteria bacterium]
MNRQQAWLGVLGGVTLQLASCGDGNVISQATPLKPEQQAARYLEQQKPDKAMTVLLDALGTDVTKTVALESGNTAIRVQSDLESLNDTLDGEALTATLTRQIDQVYASKSGAYKWASVLSSAVAQKLGMDPIDLALSLAENSSSDTSSSSTSTDTPIVALYAILPDSTESNREQVQLVVSLLEAIPSGLRTEADTLKLSLFLVAQTSLITKELDTSPADGELTPNELSADNLTPAKAVEIVNTLIAASENDAGGEGSSAEAATAIDTVVTEINGQQGDTLDEKLRNYLGSSESSS